MVPPSPQPEPDRGGAPFPAPVAAAAAGGTLLLALVLWLAGRTGDAPGRALEGLWVLTSEGPRALAWLASALGLGAWLQPRLVPAAAAPIATRAALGVAALLVVDAVAGRVGLLAGPLGAWAVLAPGLALGARALIRHRRTPVADLLPPPLAWSAAPAVAVLVVAACSAPGWLWASEFGGYDARSYHLQLPREWLALGRQQGLEHNVYSFLPSYVESAYLHLFALGGRGLGAAYAAQLLHAALACLAALAVGAAAARRHARDATGAVAAALALGTPWVVVVGALAYDEMAVALLLAGGLVVLDPSAGRGPVRVGAATGLLVGAAVGAKLTAVGFVAAPLGLLLLLRPGSARHRLVAAATAVVVSLAVLGPWLVGNALQTGNPVFPFLAERLGLGHWSPAQAAIWHEGHAADGGFGERVAQGWRQSLRYGLGVAPDPREPWSPQWSILPWLALAGAAAGLARRDRRAGTARLTLVLLVQVAFWLGFTHVKSRFLLPAVIPATLLAAWLPGLPGRRRVGGVVVFALLALYCCVPAVLFVREAGGRPAAAVGAVPELSGDVDAALLANPELSEDDRRALLATASPPFWLNHRLPREARVLGIGEAAPFYYHRADLTYATTWDRGPLSRAMREAPGGDAPAWVAALRDEGFTHVLVDPTMLDVWARAGWNDPLVTNERVRLMTDLLPLVRRWPSGTALYELGKTGGRLGRGGRGVRGSWGQAAGSQAVGSGRD